MDPTTIPNTENNIFFTKHQKNGLLYHGGQSGSAIQQTGGGQPRFPSCNGVERREREGPLEDELQPDNPDEEMRLLGDQIVAVVLRVPALELQEEGRKEVLREAGLGVEERRGDGDDEEEHEEHNVD